VILHDLDCFADLLDTWEHIGVPGVTILQSVGGFQAKDWAIRTGLASLLGLFEQDKPEQRTLFALLDDPDLLVQAIAEADRIVGGFDRPRSGILFTLPVGTVLGLQKWGKRPPKTLAQEGESSPAVSPLIQWFEEDLKARGKGHMLADWRKLRALSVAEIVGNLRVQPTIVRTDAALTFVIRAMSENSQAALACVVNLENRLMGVISQDQLGESLLVNIIPEEFIENPGEYSKTLEVASGQQPQIAADLMRSPVYVMLEDTLEAAYKRMHQAGLIGLPVVDLQYRVQGYLSLLELLTVCYPDEAQINGSE
jgi:CBS domain-containing protein